MVITGLRIKSGVTLGGFLPVFLISFYNESPLIKFLLKRIWYFFPNSHNDSRSVDIPSLIVSLLTIDFDVPSGNEIVAIILGK